MECVNELETGSNWIDQIQTPVGATWVSDVFTQAKYSSYAAAGTTFNDVTSTY